MNVYRYPIHRGRYLQLGMIMILIGFFLLYKLAAGRLSMKKWLLKKGWRFKEQMGAGFIFVKDGKQLIAATQMWTRKYVITKIPKEWKN